MTFVNALFLAGIAFVALPIVLHLIMRRKPRRFEFPALQLVKRRHQTNSQRLRLRHLLLLLLRMLVIILLAIALSRPSIKLGGVLGSQESPVAAALVFDCSPRMEYRNDNITRLKAAEKLGLWLLTQLPRESQIAVLDTRQGPATFQIDRGVARQRIERLTTIANSQPLTDVVDDALRLLAESELTRKEVYVFTDMAKSAWPADATSAIRAEAEKVPNVEVYVIDVGVKKPANFGLDELRLGDQVISANNSFSVQTKISSTRSGGRKTVEFYLLDANRVPQKRSEQSVNLGENVSEQIEFRVGSLDVGTHKGFVRIVGQDALPCDDTRFFTVDVKPAWNILVAAPRPEEDYSLFLTEAIAPLAFRRSGQARFECKIISLDRLRKFDLAPYSVVCLLDPTPLRPVIWQKLADFVSEGHGVAIFLGRNARPTSPFNQPEAQELLPGKLTIQARFPEGNLHLSPRNLEHPILAPFRVSEGAIPWSVFPVFRYWQLEKLASGAHVVVPFNNGQPALVERTLGRGHVLTMTTPVSDWTDREPWNLLPVGESWPFVILSNQMMLYLAGSGDERLNYYSGQTAVIPIDKDLKREAFLVTTPDDVKFTFAADPKRNSLVITSTDTPGNYRIQAGGKDTGVDLGFSVNLEAEQTKLHRLTKEELEEILSPLDCRVARNRSEIDRDISIGRVGRELFPTLVMLLALTLAFEYVISNRFYKE